MLFVPISLVFINFLASYIIILTTNIEWNVQESKFYFSSEPNSWHRAFYGPGKNNFNYFKQSFNVIIPMSFRSRNRQRCRIIHIGVLLGNNNMFDFGFR